jgi:predicted ATPase/DNA-binding SARP family transcriptional activator
MGDRVDGSELSIRLFGPARVQVGAATVDVGGPKQLAVLALLALSPGRPCAPAQLATALWGEDAPPSAGSTLRAYVSRLRSQLPHGVLERDGSGWRLRVDRRSVDVLHFADLLEQAAAADPARERELVEQALRLSLDDPMPELAAVPFAKAESARLRELRTGARERMLELRLAAGETREVVADAAELVEASPHREGAVASLAVALGRSGRHADALAAVESLRSRLAEDLGLDLSPAMVDLHRRLLVHDPSVASAASMPVGPVAAVAPVPEQRSAGRPLPLPLTSFVGRESDIRAVSDALEGARLVTLTGPGGAGKTRLALEALRRLEREDLDGPWLVELGDVADPSMVVGSVAQALKVATSVSVTAESIAEAVRGRRLLLVLDNCEHVIAEVASLVESLLSACGGLQVLTTSRERLGVAGERLLPVAPLRCGRPGAPGEAERLFAERAASVVPGFRLDETSAREVSRLVRSLDGIPLAVELAAARLSVLSIDDMLAMLDDRFALLEGGSRTALPHQRTLAAAVRWSYDLLEESERVLFRVASTFDGPFTLKALRGVADEELHQPAIGLLASLTAKSMVQVDRAVDLHQPRTYRLLETLRVFGRGLLDPPTRQRLAARHAAWFAGEAHDAYLGLRGPEMGRWLAHLDLVRPDMRAALRHAVEQSDRQLALRLIAGLSPYWFHRGHVQEGMSWANAALALPGTADDATEARAGLGAALLAYLSGDAAELGCVLPALAAATDTLAEASTSAVACVYAGYFEAAFGDLAAAGSYFARAGDLLAGGDVAPWAVAEVLFAQGQLLRAQGSRLEALKVLRHSAKAADACGHIWARGSARWITAKVHLDLRQGEPAVAALRAELPSCLELGIHTSTLTLLHTAAAAAAVLDRHAEGARLLGAVDAWSERLGYSPARMDPLDAEAHRRLVREGLDDAEFDDAHRSGRKLSLSDAAARVTDLAAARTPAPTRAAL